MDAVEPVLKKAKLGIFNFPLGREVKTAEEAAEAFTDAIKAHPFYDNAHSIVDLYDSATLTDGRGRVVGVVLRQALPEYAATMGAKLLLSAATRTSLRSPMFGGESPLSGIAGYFDYRGSPIELKFRKTAFTYEHEQEWPAVFPLVDYVSEIYKCVMPAQWAAQDGAIPDIVRIHNTPFSTLTINSRFRTASHTDAGDFDGGYSCIACIDGEFKGLALTFDDFRMNVLLQPRDVLVFDSHHFHSNTEVEAASPTEDWRRLTCVFYYRSALGEPAAYAEYSRRLAEAKRASHTPLAVKEVVMKANGENVGRPSPVYPVDPSPFAVVAAVHRLRHCAAKALCVHEALLANAPRLSEILFGEERSCADGLPLRAAEEKLKANADAAPRTTVRSGGFSEKSGIVQTAAEKRKYLERTYLAEFISAELLEMWTQARAKWLGLVLVEWKRLVGKAPNRTTFSWRNQSDMNSAFFDLCEVGRQVMLGLLDKEAATLAEEQAFWSLYATHLNVACAEELHMAPDAMSLRKLNVKLKDFTFGGTRYFKDMPAEEQQRRVERKRRIEEARRLSVSSPPREGKRPNWLTNDNFDYQTEQAEVDYAGQQWALPAAHAKEVTRHVHMGEWEPCQVVVRVLVVVPRAGKLEDVKPAVATGAMMASAEWRRLMSSPAVHRVLCSAARNADPLPAKIAVGNVQVCMAYADALPEQEFDFIVLQHVLSDISEDAAAAQYMREAASRCTGCLFVVETDVQCRQYYTLKPLIRADYDAVAPAFFQLLHGAAYGIPCARVRTKAGIEAVIPYVCSARYKFPGSPMNTTVHVVALE